MTKQMWTSSRHWQTLQLQRWGLSSSAADALEQALDVKSVRDLADNKYVRRAQAIVNLANEKKSH
jgi:hypothetical protein